MGRLKYTKLQLYLLFFIAVKLVPDPVRITRIQNGVLRTILEQETGNKRGTEKVA
jgi:hypothetical protein